MPIQYLKDYLVQLKSVNHENDFEEHIINWQDKNKFALTKTIEHINQIFFSEEKNKDRRLQDHPATTGLGYFNNIVILTANPGYNEKKNELESKLRKTSDGNKDFCSKFFSSQEENEIIRGLTKKMPWWKKVAKFSHICSNGINESTDEYIWDWARENKSVGAIDLIPFHSTQDGITEKLILKRTDKDEVLKLKQALINCSSATINMALRLRPKILICASGQGTIIAEQLMAENNLTATDFKCTHSAIKEHMVSGQAVQWEHTHTYNLRRFDYEHKDSEGKVTTTIVLTFPYLSSSVCLYTRLTNNSGDFLRQI